MIEVSNLISTRTDVISLVKFINVSFIIFFGMKKKI